MNRPEANGLRPSTVRRECAFTLVELLVVIAVIAILASLLLPAVTNAVESGRMAKCTSNIRQMALALTMYADDQGYFPPPLYPSSQPDPWPMVSWYAALSPYLSNWKASSSPGCDGRPRGRHYSKHRFDVAKWAVPWREDGAASIVLYGVENQDSA